MRPLPDPVALTIRPSRGRTRRNETLDQSTVLIISDEAEFSSAVTGRWQAERSEALDGKGRLFCFAMESGLWPRRKIAGRRHCRTGPLVGPIALLKAGSRL